jgi:hypothetical protein
VSKDSQNQSGVGSPGGGFLREWASGRRGGSRFGELFHFVGLFLSTGPARGHSFTCLLLPVLEGLLLFWVGCGVAGITRRIVYS